MRIAARNPASASTTSTALFIAVVVGCCACAASPPGQGDGDGLTAVADAADGIADLDALTDTLTAADGMDIVDAALTLDIDAAAPDSVGVVDAATPDATGAADGQTSTDATSPGCPSDGVACDDGNACTYLDACTNGSCIGLPKTCNDGNACTTDSCGGGYCVFLPGNVTTCDDGNPCTTGDVCSQGACSGMAIACDDGDPCTAASCDELVGGCVHTKIDKDGDGFGPGAACGGDCDDSITAIAPDVTEVCGNGVDENCDGKTDDGCPAPCTSPGFAPPACTECLDGYVSVTGGAGPDCAPDMPVWGPRPLNASAYLTDNGDGTVSDSQTKLMWQREQSVTEQYGITWQAAISHCATLSLAGHADWRLPTLAELLTLLDFSQKLPNLEASAFPASPATTYWTAVTDPGLSYPNAWYFSFAGSESYAIQPDGIEFTNSALCVR